MKISALITVAAVLLALLAARAAEVADANATIRAAGPSEIVITTTARVAGAIHSLTWNGREFLDSHDHGRQLQSAANFDAGTPLSAETYNPTEAGSARDGTGPKSSSRLLYLRAAPAALHTVSQMAFWLAPGEKSGVNLAKNTTILSASPHEAHGHRLPEPAARDFLRGRLHGADQRTASPGHFRSITGYMPPEFSRFLQFNPQTGELEPLADGPAEGPQPVVFAVPGGSHAMGIYAPPQHDINTRGPTYGRFRFRAAKVVKWNCVYRVRDPRGIAPGGYAFRMFVIVGDVATVRERAAGPGSRVCRRGEVSRANQFSNLGMDAGRRVGRAQRAPP